MFSGASSFSVSRDVGAVVRSPTVYVTLTLSALAFTLAQVTTLNLTSVLLISALALTQVATKLMNFVLRRYRSTGKLPPLAKSSIPWVGCHFEFKRDPLKLMRRYKEKYGNVFRIQNCGAEISVVTGDQAFMRWFYKQSVRRLGFLSAMRFIGLNMALDLQKGETLKNGMALHATNLLKNVALPRFPTYTRRFQRIVQQTAAQLMPGSTGTFAVRPFMRRAIGGTTLSSICGENLANGDQLMELVLELGDVMDGLAKRPIYIGKQWQFDNIRRKAYAILEPVIKHRRALQAADPENWLTKHGLTDFMSQALDKVTFAAGAKQHGFKTAEETDFEIMRSQVRILFGALTNAPQAVEFILLRILADKRVYEKVCDEIAEVFATKKGSFEPEVLREMEYLHACFEEGSRFGAFPLNVRDVLLESVELPGGYVAPVGSLIATSPLTENFDEDTWPDPDQFKPERYLDGSVDSPFANLAFGALRHHCVGKPLAEQEFKVTVAEIIRLYDLEIVPDADGKILPDTDYAMYSFYPPKGSIRIRYKLRPTPLGMED